MIGSATYPSRSHNRGSPAIGTSLVSRCWLDGAAAASGEVPHAGDFNDDGMSDIAWYNTTTGQVVLWLLNGTSVIGGGSPGSAPSPWQIAGMNAD